MLETFFLTAFSVAGILHVLKKWKFWQWIKRVPCEFCLAFWGSLPYLLTQDPYNAPALALCSATLANYLLLRLNYTE